MYGSGLLALLIKLVNATPPFATGLMQSMRALALRLKMSKKVMFHSGIILSRYLRFVQDSVVTETTRLG